MNNVPRLNNTNITHNTLYTLTTQYTVHLIASLLDTNYMDPIPSLLLYITCEHGGGGIYFW